MKIFASMLSLATLLIASQALAGQKFCSPQGSFEINPTSVTYKPLNPRDPPVVFGKATTSTGFDALHLIGPNGAQVKFVPDAQAHYTVTVAGYPKKWVGWKPCD